MARSMCVYAWRDKRGIEGLQVTERRRHGHKHVHACLVGRGDLLEEVAGAAKRNHGLQLVQLTELSLGAHDCAQPQCADVNSDAYAVDWQRCSMLR
eukprot:354664-Chlamydomonas_euryale.AAC.3